MTDSRQEHRGEPIASGISLGIIRVMQPGIGRVAELTVPTSRINAEIRSLDRAVDEAIAELRLLRESAGKRIGGPVAKIFDAQLLIAGDSEFLDQVKEQIQSQKRNAGYVYDRMVQQSIRALKNSPDQYLRQMASDIDAVATKVLTHLTGYQQAPTMKFPSDTILVAQRFTPGDVLTYRNRKAAGLISDEGGRNSHSALIARSLLVPMVVLPNASQHLPDGSRVIVDGVSGLIIVNPTPEDCTDCQKKRRRQGPAIISRIKRLTQIPPQTADGTSITVAANLEVPGPADEILSGKKIPVGLYRTEFLFLERDGFPDEQTQVDSYWRIAEQFADSHVVLRTYDLGADKAMGSNGNQPEEENPALGWRGIRMMLGMPDIFKTQVRAILRASTLSNLKILLPMVSDLGELDSSKKLISQVMLDLDRKDIPYDREIEIGVMVEVPSAAIMADQFAQKVDFISIGTNDLTQYTMSADRNNSRVGGLYSWRHPAVLHLIQITIEAGRKHNRPVTICGEAAGDPLGIPLFVGMGVRYLSMNPTRIVDACRLVKKLNRTVVTAMVQSVLSGHTASQVTNRLEDLSATLKK